MKEIDATRLKLKAMEMVEGTTLKWWEVIRYSNNAGWVTMHCKFILDTERYELAVGILQNKPVWAGDTLYDCKGAAYVVGEKAKLNFAYWSWNLPKPKTIMVELPVEDVEYWNALGEFWEGQTPPDSSLTYTEKCNAFYEACRKALEGIAVDIPPSRCMCCGETACDCYQRVIKR